MTNYREGANINSVCAYCEKGVTATLTNVTLSLCDGLEEVENVLVDICDQCGNMVSYPAQSLSPIQQAHKKLVESGGVSDSSEITIELKSIVERKKGLDKESESDYQHEYPLRATG